MSYFERQKDAFSGSLSAAAAKLGGPSATSKRPLAPPSPSLSVTSSGSAAAAAGVTPTKKRDGGGGSGGPAIVYSQPENTGVGESVMTQMTYVIDWLKGKDEAKGLHDILGHLSAQGRPEAYQRIIVELLRNNPRVQWLPDPALSEQTLASGAYKHRPVIPNVRSATELLAFLQRRPDAQGVSVKDLKDGWPECEPVLRQLADEHRVLLIVTKKDNHPRAVWADDASLWHPVDQEFRHSWLKVEVPSLDNIVQRLAAVGQKPTSEDPRLKAKAAPKVEKKKKRAVRRTGKSTNTHMEHLLKDYSHLKR